VFYDRDEWEPLGKQLARMDAEADEAASRPSVGSGYDMVSRCRGLQYRFDGMR